jgi:hypothetical protein
LQTEWSWFSEIRSLRAAEYRRTGIDNNPNDKKPFQTVVAMYLSGIAECGQYTLHFLESEQHGLFMYHFDKQLAPLPFIGLRHLFARRCRSF